MLPTQPDCTISLLVQTFNEVKMATQPLFFFFFFFLKIRRLIIHLLIFSQNQYVYLTQNICKMTEISYKPVRRKFHTTHI